MSDVTECQMYSVSDVMYEGILNVNPGIFVPLMCLHPVTECQPRRRGACPAYHTPAGAFCLRTALAASTYVTLCYLSPAH